MPRVKVAPVRRKSFNRRLERMESNEADDSVLDDEEVSRIEEELEKIRRHKANQIQKLRRIREEKRLRGSPSSSSDSDVVHAEQSDHEDSKPNETRPSARALADGLDKAQQRFMFNVQRMEEKYAERERRGLPESLVEMDRYGNFYFPDNMAGRHQQSFINRMYLNDAKFGKGLVSAPRNSIDSLDGDIRALKKCRQLDEKFGRKLRKSDMLESGVDGRRDRMKSSVSGITLRTESASTAGRYTNEVFEDLEDDVFCGRDRPYRRPRSNQQPERHLTTSTIGSFFDKEESDSEEEDFADDEENSGEESDESGDEEEEEDMEEDDEQEDTPVAAGKVNKIFKSNESVASSCRPLVKNETITPTRTIRPESIFIKTETDHAKTVSMTSPQLRIKNEVGTTPQLTASEIKRRTPRISSVKQEPIDVKPIPVVEISDDDLSDLKKIERNRKITDFLKPVPKIAVHDTTATRTSTQPTSVPGSSSNTIACPMDRSETAVESTSKVSRTPRPSRLVLSATGVDNGQTDGGVNTPSTAAVASTSKTADKTPNVSFGTAVNAESSNFEPTVKSDIVASVRTDENSTAMIGKNDSQLSVRPARKRKPTSKIAEANERLTERTVNPHEHCHDDHSDNDQPSTSARKPDKNKKKGRAKSPFCKHCELMKEEKKQARLSAKHKKTEEAGTPHETLEKRKSVKSRNTPQTENQTPGETALEKTKNAKKTPTVVSKKTTTDDTPKGKNTAKVVKSPDEESSGKKRRSATVGSNEPEMKKKKLTEMDILSIPSSTAVVVDTELIAANNSQLVSENLPKFSENLPDVSIWTTDVDSRWINDVRKAAKKAKGVKFFGVSIGHVPQNVSLISLWVENILISSSIDKDPFQSDLRRMMAQSKQARNDVKAGYDIRR